MKCPNCGAEIEEGSVYCPDCGFSQEASKGEPREVHNLSLIHISEVLNQGAGFSADIHLYVVNVTVTHVRDREVDHTVSAQEGKSPDRTVQLHSCDSDVAAGKVDNSKCF